VLRRTEAVGRKVVGDHSTRSSPNLGVDMKRTGCVSETLLTGFGRSRPKMLVRVASPEPSLSGVFYLRHSHQRPHDADHIQHVQIRHGVLLAWKCLMGYRVCEQ
jgi:hypothetical protein